MSDDDTRDVPATPEDTPTRETPAPAGAPAWPANPPGTATGGPPVTEPQPIVVDDPGTVPPNRSSHVSLPKWLVFGVAALLLLAVGFGAGWLAHGDDDDDRAVISGRFPNTLPFGGDDGPDPFPDFPREGGGYLGVRMDTTPDDDGQGDDGQDDGDGVRIAAVSSDSPAEEAGLRAGDVITEVDDESVDTPVELASEIRSHDAGDEVTIGYERDGDERTVDVTLAERDDSVDDARPS
jgi:membrane-associated protease RseP (regulator of RpoE activity)